MLWSTSSCHTIFSSQLTWVNDINCYSRTLESIPINPKYKDDFAKDLSLQSGATRNKFFFSLPCQADDMNNYSKKELKLLLECNSANHVTSSLIKKDQSVALSRLPMTTTYISTEEEKILIDHLLREPQYKDPRMALSIETIKKAIDFLAYYNWQEITLTFNQMILSAFKFTHDEDSNMQISLDLIKCNKIERKEGPMNNHESELVEWSLDVRKISLKDSEHIKNYIMKIAEDHISATINDHLLARALHTPAHAVIRWCCSDMMQTESGKANFKKEATFRIIKFAKIIGWLDDDLLNDSTQTPYLSHP